jgi:hypothetical protein
MRGSAVQSQKSLVVQEQVPGGHFGPRGDAPHGLSLDASMTTWVRPGSLCSSAMGLMHARVGGSLRTGSLRSKILGRGEKRKGKRGWRKHSAATFQDCNTGSPSRSVQNGTSRSAPKAHPRQTAWRAGASGGDGNPVGGTTAKGQQQDAGPLQLTCTKQVAHKDRAGFAKRQQLSRKR